MRYLFLTLFLLTSSLSFAQREPVPVPGLFVMHKGREYTVHRKLGYPNKVYILKCKHYSNWEVSLCKYREIKKEKPYRKK